MWARDGTSRALAKHLQGLVSKQTKQESVIQSANGTLCSQAAACSRVGSHIRPARPESANIIRASMGTRYLLGATKSQSQEHGRHSSIFCCHWVRPIAWHCQVWASAFLAVQRKGRQGFETCDFTVYTEGLSVITARSPVREGRGNGCKAHEVQRLSEAEDSRKGL